MCDCNECYYRRQQSERYYGNYPTSPMPPLEKSQWHRINNIIKDKKIMSKVIFVREGDIDNYYKTFGECVSDNDDNLNDDDVVIEYQEVRRFKVSKPKVGLVEIKSKTKKK